MSKPEEFKFDSRVRDRFMRSRVLNAAEVQQHLDALPDLEGEYEVLDDTPQPAVTPPRSEVHDEPLVFDGIRRLQALSEVHSPPPAPRYVPPAPVSSGLPAYREPESRPLGTPLRSALMESEISGVGAGAVSAALGAMAAEARGASVFGVPASIPQPPPPVEDVTPPVTLRSEPSVQPAAPRAEVAPAVVAPAVVAPAVVAPAVVAPAEAVRADVAPAVVAPAEAVAEEEEEEDEADDDDDDDDDVADDEDDEAVDADADEAGDDDADADEDEDDEDDDGEAEVEEDPA